MNKQARAHGRFFGSRNRIRLAALIAAFAPGTLVVAANPNYVLEARIVAVGVRGVGGVRQVGAFHAGGPIPGNPEFLLQTRPGRVLDPGRILVASAFNFGAPLGNARQAPGAILSIDPSSPEPLVIQAELARAEASRGGAGSAIQLFTAQNPAYLNRAYNRNARTADEPAVSNPRYISINNAFGRPWIANSPYGTRGPGTNSVLDPDGRPFDNAPSDEAGGVFAGSATNRVSTAVVPPRSKPPGVIDKWLRYRATGQLTAGGLEHGALGTAFLGPSPDTTGFAVFAVAGGDGSIAQVHVQDGVDGLAPPGTVTPVNDQAEIIGMAFKWIPDRTLFVADRARDRIAVLALGDDARHFKLAQVDYLSAPELKAPIDIAAAVPELANPRFSSHTTLAGGSDLYVANRGDGSLLRLNQEGRVLARAQVRAEGLGIVAAERLRGIAVSADTRRIWLTLEGELPQFPGHEGIVLEVAAFDATGPYFREQARAAAPSSDVAKLGKRAFVKQFSPKDGLGPLFNARSCLACHSDPVAGGSSAWDANFAVRVARIDPATGRVEPLEEANSPVARRRSTRELGERNAPLPGIPRAANVTSLRMPPALFELAGLDRIPDEAILANAVSKGDGIRGRPNRVLDAKGEQRIARYGWKADVANLDEIVARAFATELGITTPLSVALDPRSANQGVDDDGRLVQAVVAYLRTLRLPQRSAAR